VLAYQGAQPPLAGHTLERTFATVVEPVPRSGDDVTNCRGHQYLAGACQCRHARTDVHGHAGDVGAAHLDLTGVNAHPHLDAQHMDRVDDFVRTGERGAGTAEGRDESISRGVDFASPESL